MIGTMSRLFLLFAALLAIYVIGDWALPLIDRDEPRFSEASREMLERRDFIVPYFNNQVRFDKPPLIYWLQDGAYLIFGENEFAARLPSGICAALAAVFVAVWGRQLYGEKIGIRAGIMFGLCLQTIVHAHAAVADMPMIAASIAAAWAGWNWLTAPQKRWRWWLAFWGLLAIGFLAKGPIAWAPIGMAGWAAGRMRREQRPCAVGWMAGIVVMLALVGIWGIPALIMTHGQYAAVGLGKHVVMRTVAPMEGHGARSWWSYAVTFPYYFLTVWPSFFPWSIWLAPVTIAYWKRRKEWAPHEAYLIAGVVLVFGIFTLSATKLPHYTLPAFPYMALLLAAWWGAEREAAFRRAAAGMAAFSLALELVAFPLTRRYFASQQIYDAARQSLTPGMELATVEYHEPSLVWLFRRRIHGFQTQMDWKAADHWMHEPGPRVCVLPTAMVRKSFRRLDPAWREVRASGYDVANGRKSDLTAILKM
ncbi:MAG TPA: glycosyltransferase family 39 protein [Chthoniobacteraceae bacterium]|jgi:4-amino-4-deoxy-L-arabinose transferase-like glycosyltransferase|nr:glycosyltransferase family 39 protein [Chthoniobacteraceae bacterium]